MKGLDLLGLGSRYWPVKMTIKELPEESAIGCFDTTFGDVIKNLRIVLSSGKIRAARVHIWYSVHHTLCPIGLLKKRLPLYDGLCKEFPAITFYISHTCEYRSTETRALARRINLIRTLAPLAVPVNSKLAGARLRDVHTEIHAKRKLAARKHLVSNDGFELTDAEFREYLRAGANAEMCFTWIPSFNLRRDLADAATPPPQRKHKPTRKEMRRMVRITYG